MCPPCFQDYYVRRIQRTVESFKMFKPDDTVGVAVSGGKDSAALLHGLSRVFPDAHLVALHVDLGIEKYSEHCRRKVETLAKLLNVELHVFDLKEELGFTIDDFRRTVFRRKICSPCGTIKRHVFEELSQRAGVKVLATGHNLDDMVGIMLNNFFSGNWAQLVRLKPVLRPFASNQTVKVKPLIRTTERENLLYCLYADVPIREVDCPHAGRTQTLRSIELLRALSRKNPSFRQQALKNFLKLIPLLEENIEKPRLTTCKICGFPSSSDICAYCKRVKLIKELDKAWEESLKNRAKGKFPLERGDSCKKHNCVRCCVNTEMPLTRKDLKRIENLGYARKRFAVKTGDGWRLKNENGKCVFLAENGCAVYEHRPEGCRLYPLVYDEERHRAVLDRLCPFRHEFEVKESDFEKLRRLLEILDREKLRQT